MTDSILPSMSLESRRCEQSIHDSRRLSKKFPEVVELLGMFQWYMRHAHNVSDAHKADMHKRIDKCLAALKGQKGT